ncbi:MAG TPA: DUF3025 domain-containing protein [Advenella sp.]|nr:DUF3025 domain-containing protein [Advenella sp.]
MHGPRHMIVDVLSGLDTTRPWWSPLRAWLPGHPHYAAVLQAAAGMGSPIPVAPLLNALAPPACPVRFTNQSALPAGMAYEQFIGQHGMCPTRDNLHDFFNGLCWFRFPKIKTLFNKIQCRQILRQGVGQRRGVVRDTITLLDEGGLLLQAPPALWNAIEQRDWRRAFIKERALWQQTHIGIIGHALLEKCVNPYKAITANVIRVPQDTPAGDLDLVMAHTLETLLTEDPLQVKPHRPLPVMGIPGWDAANEDPAFYDDPLVFRPPRASGPSRPLLPV